MTAFQQMGGKAVSQRMHRGVLGDACLGKSRLERLLERGRMPVLEEELLKLLPYFGKLSRFGIICIIPLGIAEGRDSLPS